MKQTKSSPPAISQMQAGFSLVFMVIGLGLISVSILFVMTYVQTMATQARFFELTGTRDRIWTSIEMMIGQPAAIRNSARASDPSGNPLNPELRNCVNGVTAGGCQDRVEFGFALFSPVVAIDATGRPIGVQQISVPPASTTKMMFDAFGFPCTQGTSNCVFVVTTTFVPHCAPPVIAALPADPMSPNIFASAPTCTVAEFLEVNYSIGVFEDIATGLPTTHALSGKTGSLLVAVKKISGNDPQ